MSKPLSKRPYSTPGTVYPHFNHQAAAADQDSFSSAPQSPQHNGTNSYETVSELSVYQSALDLDTRSAKDTNDVRPTKSSAFGRPSSLDSPIEAADTSYQPPGMSGLLHTSDVYFRNGTQRIDFVLAHARAEGGREERNREARKIFEKNLLDEGLLLEYETEEGRNVSFVKIHAPWDVLARYAEILKFKMPMKKLENLTRCCRLDDFNNPIGLAVAFSNSSMFRSVSKEELTCDVVTSGSPGKEPGYLDRVTNVFRLDPLVFPRRKKLVKIEFAKEKEFLFDFPEDKDEFFSPSERSRIVDFILKRKRYTNNIDNILSFGMTKLLADEVYAAAYPLHEGYHGDAYAKRTLLRHQWTSLSKMHKYQPLDAIKDYFGVKIALYFAWLGFYTFMLIPASVVGFICFVYGCFSTYNFVPTQAICRSNHSYIMCPVCDHCEFWRLEESCVHSRISSAFDNPAVVFFAVFMSFWGATFLEMWKRYSATITYYWDLTGFDQNEEHPRPEYLARFQHLSRMRQTMNPITRTMEPYISFWKRKFPAAVLSVSVVLLLVSLAFAAVMGVIFYRMSVSVALTIHYDSGGDDAAGVVRNVPIITTVTAASINLVCIMIFNRIYARVAEYLTERELPRTQSEFDDSLTLKMFSLQFVNYYASIFYIAFFKGRIIGYPGGYERLFGYRQEECGPGGCLLELAIQLAIIMVGKQAFSAFVEMLLPLFWQWRQALVTKFRPAADRDEDVPSWERDFQLIDMGQQGLFWEYLEMVLQFGFVTIFVAAFPLAPIFALLNNVLETRLDAKKLLFLYRRPVSTRIRSIGVWYRIMDCIGKISVITNAFIIAFTSNFIPSLVYRASVSADGSLDGYLNFSLAYFDVRDFGTQHLPKESQLSRNLTYCRYNDFREPPWADNRYEATKFYWCLLAARLTFVICFENVVMIVITFVRWLVPDVPKKLQDRLRYDACRTNEILVELENLRARKQNRADGDVGAADAVPTTKTTESVV